MTLILKLCLFPRVPHLPYSIINKFNRVSRISQNDPILSIYTHKLQEFMSNKQSSSGNMVGINKEQRVRYNDEVERLKKLFGDVKLEVFPQFYFE